MNNKIPDHWATFEMLDVIDYEGGSQPPKKVFIYEPRAGYVRLIQIRDYGQKPFPTYVPATNKLKYTEEDDIMIARYGGKAGEDSLGRICGGIKGAYNVALTKVIYPKKILPRSFVKYLLSGPWLKERLNSLSRSCQSGFNRDDLRGLMLPLPPLPEQKRIVEKLDYILPKVKSVKARLDEIPQILKRFRQSILAAACSGKLTEDWREDNPDMESSEIRFNRINETRLAVYASKLAEAKKNKKPKPKKHINISNKLYLENIEHFNSLPMNWLYLPLARLSSDESDSIVDGPFGTSINVKTDYIDSGVPVVRINNIRPFSFVAENFKYVRQQKFLELRRHNIRKNDVLLVKVGATIGDCCRYTFELEGLLSTTGSCRIRVDDRLTSSSYLCLVLNSFKNYLQQIASEMAQPFLNMKRIKNLPFPVPPIEEQQEIVRRVEQLFKLADSLEAKYKKAMERVEKIEQSVLAKAFRGELVAQDPNDEHAEELLKRILAEKAKLESIKKKPKRSKSRTTKKTTPTTTGQ